MFTLANPSFKTTVKNTQLKMRAMPMTRGNIHNYIILQTHHHP